MSLFTNVCKYSSGYRELLISLDKGEEIIPLAIFMILVGML